MEQQKNKEAGTGEARPFEELVRCFEQLLERQDRIIELLEEASNEDTSDEYSEAYKAIKKLKYDTLISRFFSSEKAKNINSEALYGMTVNDFLETDNKILAKELYQVGPVTIKEVKKQLRENMENT